MIRWKNRSIDQLSPVELRAALRDLAGNLTNHAAPERMILDSFWVGMAVGLSVSLFGLIIARVMF